MEATKYYFLDFAHKEAGVSSFLDALASLDFKLSVSESVIYRFSNYFTASASTGLSGLLLLHYNESGLDGM